MRSKQIALGLLFVCGALLCGAVGLYSSIRASNRAIGLTPVTVALLQDCPLGEEVLVEGRVSRRNPVRLPSAGFVAYVREWREITYDDEGRPDPGSWFAIERVTPPLLLDLSDGLVQIENHDYDIENAIVIDDREAGESADEYRSRYRGISGGDTVIAIGVLSAHSEQPRVQADFIARGTRARYVTRRRIAGTMFCALSIVVAVLGGTALLWDRLGGLFPRDTGHRKQTPETSDEKH